MVFKKLVFIIYNFIRIRGRLRPQIKVTLSDSVKVKEEGLSVSQAAAVVGSESRDEVLHVGEVCCVCLSRVKEGEDKRVLPCRHEFHRMCVDRWFKACRKTCPVCRFSMGDENKFRKREELTEEMVIWFSSFHVAGF